VGFLFLSPRSPSLTLKRILQELSMAPRFQTSKAIANIKLSFNADVVAIAIALAFAALIRLNIIHHIGW
jgi:hypothetical protein